MSDTLQVLAPYFCQVGYVVTDLVAAEEWFRQVMGVPRFLRMENVEFGDTCRHRGRPADYAIHVALGYARDIQIELIQAARGRSIYTEFLEANRPGLHHLAFAVPDFAAAAAHLRGSGLDPIVEGVIDAGMRTEFAYFDSGAAGASVIELLGFDAAAQAFMDQLKRGEW
jgi:methylmalonyl-CoA/ethylmalonyl-CoA epimerase